jgi:Fur family ferric uptake transcriptional regulator
MGMVTEDWERTLRDHGFRITPQRQLVLEAVEQLQHGTPEEILVEVQRTASGVNLSTIYRTLEVLEEVGLVTHAHIGHGPPTYHSVDEHVHIHLVCDRCHAVMSVPAQVAQSFVDDLEATYGFRTDISHVSVHGLCANCKDKDYVPEADDPL